MAKAFSVPLNSLYSVLCCSAVTSVNFYLKVNRIANKLINENGVNKLNIGANIDKA